MTDEHKSSQTNPDRRPAPGPQYGGNAGPPGSYGGAPYGAYGPYTAYNQPYYGPPSGTLTLTVILRIVRRSWLLAMLLGAVGLALGYYILTKITPMYRAHSKIEMSLRKPRILATQGALMDQGSRASSFEIYNARIEKMKSYSILEIVLDKYRAMHPGDKRQDALIAEVIAEVTVSRSKNSRIINFVSVHADPELAARVVNAFAEASEYAVFKENKESSDKAVEWLQSQALAQRKMLVESEERLLEYRKNNQMDVLESEKKALNESSIALSQNLVTIESATILISETLSFLTRLDDDPSKVSEMPMEIPGRVEIMVVVEKLRIAMYERAALMIKYTAKHPEVLKRDDEVRQLGLQLLTVNARARAGVANSLVIKRGQVKSLREKLEGQSRRISALELQTVKIRSELNTLERESDATQVSYNGILKRIEEARLSADEDTATVQIVDLSPIPQETISPDRPRVYVVGVVFGILMGFGLGTLSEVLDDRVKSSMEIERDFGLRVLGIVPRIRKIQRHELALAGLNNKFGYVTEAFAGVRSILDSPQFEDVSRSILIASSTPEEGKTITSSNLAGMFARSGQKTLLIDFDLRRPRMARIYEEALGAMDGEAQEYSLLHRLASGGKADWKGLPLQGPEENLYVITSQASQTISPAEVIGSDAVKELMSWATENFDRVIIDSPPLGVISDSNVLASLVDCVILVCRPNKSRTRLIRHMLDQFRTIGANVIGVIINDLDLRKDSFFDAKYKYMNYSYQQAYQNSDVPTSST
jgi:succinoglycan biosynthesis transport protein ExoP